MKTKVLVTEYKEGLDKKADDFGGFFEELSTEYLEDDQALDPPGGPMTEMIDGLLGDSDSAHDMEIVEFVEEEPKVVLIPGSDLPMNEAEDDEEKEEEPKETSWEDDRNVEKFMEFIVAAYPAGIPAHDGRSIVGCERAINYLNDLNKQISEALRADRRNVLDPVALENVRVNMMRDMMTLKNHMNKLRTKVKEQFGKKSNEEIEAEIKVATEETVPGTNSVKIAELLKEGTTPGIQLVMTPLERALSGIIINSVISAGHPFEDVYEFLKKKYKLSPREELSLLQLIMDMGYPIFKDRGTISEALKGEDEEDNSDSKQGLDFLKNYFA